MSQVLEMGNLSLHSIFQSPPSAISSQGMVFTNLKYGGQLKPFPYSLGMIGEVFGMGG